MPCWDLVVLNPEFKEWLLADVLYPSNKEKTVLYQTEAVAVNGYAIWSLQHSNNI
jgi:hypothetical protein